ncbi:MAG: hypothetical protein MR913_12670 [Clostridiales bacterium]|nr:hypothetical protein [Clostridiales bacterium]
MPTRIASGTSFIRGDERFVPLLSLFQEVFTADSPFYEENIVTKQSLQKRLEVYYDMERGVIPIQLDGGNTKEVLEGYIERTKAAIERSFHII